MSDAQQTTGTLVKRAGVTIAEQTNVIFPKFSRPKIPTTTHNDGRESNQLGIVMQQDGGFDLNWLPDDPTHIQIFDDFDNNTKALWAFVQPDGATMSGQGRVGKFEPGDAPAQGAVQTVSCSIVWAGPVTIT